MLTPEELARYDRQIMLHGFGEAGQAKLKNARVFVAGAGGLGSPAAIYLAAAGIGNLRIVDDDEVELSNLNRQILHWQEDIKGKKAYSAAAKLARLNPDINIEGVVAKVIRPQDMPLQVASGNFDLAITGRDWLIDHRYQFPSSPVAELLNLKSGRVRMVAVISQKLPADNVADLRKFIEESPAPFRVASEYVNIADRYARDNRFGRYRVIPTWGATEAFLPDDADLLIENTETGRTIARHNLRIIDTLFESTACLIGNTRIKTGSARGGRIKYITESLRTAVEDG